jgi:hypothetical protein
MFYSENEEGRNKRTVEKKNKEFRSQQPKTFSRRTLKANVVCEKTQIITFY